VILIVSRILQLFLDPAAERLGQLVRRSSLTTSGYHATRISRPAWDRERLLHALDRHREFSEPFEPLQNNSSSDSARARAHREIVSARMMMPA